MAQVAAGDEQAVTDLYTHYAAAVRRFAHRIVDDTAIAEDITQEVFIDAWRSSGRFRGEAALKTYLQRIAYYEASTWLKRRRLTLSLDDAAAGEKYEQIADERQALAWQNETLRSALAGLKPKHRAVIELAFGLDLSQAEIAQQLQCPIGTVKSRLNYALKEMRARLKASD